MQEPDEAQEVELLSAKLCAHFSNLLRKDAEELGPGEIQRRMVVGVRRARSWGFRSEYGIGMFVLRMLTGGPNFDCIPAFRAILSNPDLDEAAKSRALDASELMLWFADALRYGMEWEERDPSQDPPAPITNEQYDQIDKIRREMLANMRSKADIQAEAEQRERDQVFRDNRLIRLFALRMFGSMRE